MVLLGEFFPNFQAQTTKGSFSIYNYIDQHWCLFFSHPAAFTPVCTSELAEAASLIDEFDKRNVKLIAVSSDKLDAHSTWITDIIDYGDLNEMPYPIIEDPEQTIAISLGMIDQTASNADGIHYTCRGCFLISPDKRIRMTLFYPAWVGRNFKELLRAIDSIQLCDRYPVATPANWEPGDKCMITHKINDIDAENLFKTKIEHLKMPSGKDYMKLVEQISL